MADAVLSFVLDQLSTYVRDESTLLGGLRDEVQHIKDELGQMKGFLRRAEAIVENNPDLEAWVSQVRDVAYDAEDVLDEFILRFGRRHYDDGFLGRVRKVYGSIKNLKARHQLATKINTIKDRIKNISDAHQRYTNQYGIFEQGSTATIVQNRNQNTWYDCRGDALLLEEADLVGVERPKEELMNMLFASDLQLHVIPVVGMAGLGKTTLVKTLYDDTTVKNRFKHHAWVTVSQSFKIGTLLRDAIQQLLKELNLPAPHELDTMGIDRLKLLVRDLLLHENYILVFDDVWRTTDWNAIRMAFPKNNCGNRIMITTRIGEVGQAALSDTAGDIYRLDPLTKEQSWNLFCKKAFWATSCPHHLEEISRNIVERCAGLPLAIVVIGGVMAIKSRRTAEWYLFYQSLGEQLAGNNQLENMTKLLTLSCYDLPDHLRMCFLYLSILPEDVFIKKKRLIRLWIAEGFVQKKEGMTIEEVAESYLNELINRSLVQVARRTLDGRLKACRIHDIIYQIILRKAREQNITTIFSEQGMQFPNKMRRLVIHSSIDNAQVSNGSLKSLRSLLLSESTESVSKPFLSELLSNRLRLLKVLDLRGTPLEVIPEEIFEMLHLKYLSLRKTLVTTIPKSIQKLRMLETLDLKYTNVRELPVEILKLQQLRHLLVLEKGIGFQASYKIGNLKSLQSLRYIDANNKVIVKEIGKLTQLRKLGITKLRREDGKEFCSSLEKLTNLRSLRIASIDEKKEIIDLQYSLSSTLGLLQKLELRGRLEKAPEWILSLHGLTKIHLYWSRLRDEPLQLLQDLPNLVQFGLWQAYEGEELCFKAGGFLGLKILWISNMEELRRVKVEEGAMPLLEQLRMEKCESVEELPAGIESLTCLQRLEFVDMPDTFVRMLDNMMDKQKVDYWKISRTPQVRISNWINGERRSRYL